MVYSVSRKFTVDYSSWSTETDLDDDIGE